MLFARFLLTRDLIVLQQIMLSCGSPHEVPLEATEIIHSTFLPRCVVLNHSYFIISWINETHSTAPPNDSLEQVHIFPIFYYVLPLHSMIFCYQNCSDLWKNCSSDRENLLKLEAEGRGICKNFEITWTIYSNCERSEQFLVTECFFDLFLEVSQT